MGAKTELQTPFVTNLEELFFEIGKLLALCKTPDQQRQLLDKILTQIEDSKGYANPYESSKEDALVVKEQLFRHYQKGFARWGLKQLIVEKTITDITVIQKGGLLSYDEKTRHHEESRIPHNLLVAFLNGWASQKHMGNHEDETPSQKPTHHPNSTR